MIKNYEEPNFIFLDELESTNNYIANMVRSRQIIQPTIVSADYQTAGRGQRATKWQSFKSQNALFSLFVQWNDLKIEDQFILAMLAALSVCEVLKDMTQLEVKVKWPNDIYVQKKKIGGILIESELRGTYVVSSIIGIGLNINQVNFDSEVRATSLKLETGQEHDRYGVIKNVSRTFLSNCQSCVPTEKAFPAIKKLYLRCLIGLNENVHVMEIATMKMIQIQPLDITASGLLIALDTSGVLRTFEIKELQWIL
jgi:BirA family biotin operon repressor/biotin-[acetyl-CoA-carboxylase] ligase